MIDVDSFYIGPPKSASSWLYECCQEHPEICVPDIDSTHYFDLQYDLADEQWYADRFDDPSRLCIDFCQAYLDDHRVPKRMHEQYPEARFITTLRNPVDRAYSHYWHGKKKNRFNYEFREVLENKELFSAWIRTGFYHEHLTRYLEYFPEDRIKILYFSDLKEDNGAFLKEVFEYLGVDPDFRPLLLDTKVNKADYQRNFAVRSVSRIGQALSVIGLHNVKISLKDLGTADMLKSLFSSKSEYDRGMEEEVRQKLIKIYEPDIHHLEELIDKDLSHWLK